MHVKATMKAVPRSELSDHELKRCRALAHGNAWQVIEEDLLWWSLDKASWTPVMDNLNPSSRRWLMVETEEGVEPVFLWEVRERIPAAEPQRDREHQPAYSPFVTERA